MTDSWPTTTDVQAASQAIVEIVRCQVSVSIQSKKQKAKVTTDSPYDVVYEKSIGTLTFVSRSFKVM